MIKVSTHSLQPSCIILTIGPLRFSLTLPRNPIKMNMWSYLPGANNERADDDRVHLVKAVDSDSVGDANVDRRNDDDVDDEEEDEEENVDKSTADNLAGRGRCDRDGLVECEDSKGLDYSSSLDVNEVCVNVEQQANTKKLKKPLRKRVRKRVWRAVRTSWKYFRRGMTAYSPALSSMFLWGVNFNQPVRTSKTSHRYF